MSKVFSEYATSPAFAVQLTKTQCNALLRYRRDGFINGWVPHHGMATLKSLEARGLAEWSPDENGHIKFKGLTKAGELMIDLLIEAGLTVENTNSVSVLKRAA